jgi:anthranilate phosphoribosyltransferase
MTLDLAPWIREIGRGAHGAHSLERGQARALMAAMLDGEVPDLELGAILIAMRVKGESPDETLGFLEALAERVLPLDAPPDRPRPVVLPSYNGARRGANLTPLVALMLARYGVPVLVHGLARGGSDDEGDDDEPGAAEPGFGRVTSAAILEELGVAPSTTLAEADMRLARGQVAYVPTAILSPGLARLLATRARVGLRSSAHTLAKLIDPFGGTAVRVVSVSHPDYLVRMREVLAATRADALLLRGTEGEPYANPKRCPRLEMIRHGAAWRTVDAEEGSLAGLPALPATNDAATTARWIAETLSGEHPLTGPIVQQLALLLEAAQAPLDAAVVEVAR